MSKNPVAQKPYHTSRCALEYTCNPKKQSYQTWVAMGAPAIYMFRLCASWPQICMHRTKTNRQIPRSLRCSLNYEAACISPLSHAYQLSRIHSQHPQRSSSMGYTCDVCSAATASVYSVGDAAVMCKGCSTGVQTSNPSHVLQHELLSLAQTNDRPSCDICQACCTCCRMKLVACGQRATQTFAGFQHGSNLSLQPQDNKAMVFCAEDRALMCRGCDVMVHSANAHVARHARHLLTGWVVGLHATNADEAGSSADTATMGMLMPSGLPSTSARDAGVATTKRTTNKGHPYRANGTAEYEDYDALRQLLGYPTPNPPSRKNSGLKPPKVPTTRGGMAASSGASGSAAAGPTLHELTTGAGAAGPTSSFSAEPLPLDGPSTSQPPVTLTAAELLGMPIADELSAKDIDAVFMPDMYTALDDFDTDFSSLFAVPDFGPPADDGGVIAGSAPVAFKVGCLLEVGAMMHKQQHTLRVDHHSVPWMVWGNTACHPCQKRTMAWYLMCLALMSNGSVCDLACVYSSASFFFFRQKI